MHPVEQLWLRHHPPRGYPAGVVAVPEPIPGIAFFPGGYGLWRPDTGKPIPECPREQVMVLGHDFHSEEGYRASLRRTREAATQPTWRHLLQLLTAVDIAPESCFFTNIYMGLRAGAVTTGRFPGASDADFVRHCELFLREQLQTMRPRLILTLGINVPPFLARVVPALGAWASASSLRRLDEAGPVQRAIELPTEPAATATVVALTHPSLRHASIRHRSYGELVGDAAEIAMVRDALRDAEPPA